MMFLFISKPDFACNPHALWKHIVENTEHETAWLVSDRNHLESLRHRGIRCELYDTVKGNELLEKAKYIISNVYVFGALPKKEGQIFVNLWHGSGVKAHDFYDVNLLGQQEKKVLDFSSKTDLMCVHSLDDRFRLSAMLHYDLRKSFVTGQPRLDSVVESNGREKLARVLGQKILQYKYLLFFVPSFRANSSSHSGKFYSDNVLRLDDYDASELNDFLEKNNAALVYKLHPIEQTALKGVAFQMSKHCYELTDDMLFDADVRYDEFLNAFSLMISDYSSIAFDYLLLDRPIIYLIPDYEEYKHAKGFVFNNIDAYMPGQKVYTFKELLQAIKNALENPGAESVARAFVLQQRFDYVDNQSAKRCYETIVNYKALQSYGAKKQSCEQVLPSSAELIKKYIPKDIRVIDSTCQSLDIKEDELSLYITEEVPDEYRSVSCHASTDIADLPLYYKIKDMSNVKMGVVTGGVDNEHFNMTESNGKSNEKTRIGFAGTIDCRIYFAMVQYICEAFPDYEVVFCGDIYGEYPAWLDGYDNLEYLGAVSYDELPSVIQTFDVAILPFYGEYQKKVPNELYQYLACGKQVVASNMLNLPECKAIYKSKSVADAVVNIKKALMECNNEEIKKSALEVAKTRDWKVIADELIATLF